MNDEIFNNNIDDIDDGKIKDGGNNNNLDENSSYINNDNDDELDFIEEADKISDININNDEEAKIDTIEKVILEEN